MLGLYLNVILSCFAVLSLAAGISFFKTSQARGPLHSYVLLFCIASAIICSGYAVMGFTPDVKNAYIPRLVGLYGIDTFLLMEFSFLLLNMKVPGAYRAVLTGLLALYEMFDLIIFGNKSSLHYVRFDFYTSYESSLNGAHIFHYSYIFVMFVTLLVIAIIWYKQKKISREKSFCRKIIVANLILVVLSLPDAFGSSFSRSYPTIGYSFGFFIVAILWRSIAKWFDAYTLTAVNVTREVFYMINTPLIIFDLDGIIRLVNPSAEKYFDVSENVQLREFFYLSDVDTLRILAKIKQGHPVTYMTKSKHGDHPCNLDVYVKIDYRGDAFCAICKVDLLDSVAKGERVQLEHQGG